MKVRGQKTEEGEPMETGRERRTGERSGRIGRLTEPSSEVQRSGRMRLVDSEREAEPYEGRRRHRVGNSITGTEIQEERSGEAVASRRAERDGAVQTPERRSVRTGSSREETVNKSTKRTRRSSGETIENRKTVRAKKRRDEEFSAQETTVHSAEQTPDRGTAQIADRSETRRAKSEKNTAGSGTSTNGSASSTGWKEKLQARRKKRIRRVILGIGGVLAVAYLAVAVYFSFHFYEDTEIYGIDCSQKTLEEAKAEVIDKLGDYQLAIVERGDRTEYVTAEEIDLEFVDNGSVDRMMRAQRAYVWPVMLLLERSNLVAVSFSYDREKAVKTLEALDCRNPIFVVAPQDAYIKTTDIGFVVEAEVMGTTLDQEKTEQAFLAALDAGSTTLSLEDEGCYVDPVIYQDNEQLQRDAASMNELGSAYITYDFGDRQEVVNAPVIQDWIVKLEDGTFVIDDSKVTAYVESLAAKYDTFGLPREFYTSLGTTVTLEGGDYGWCMDQEATLVSLLNALEEGYQGTMEPDYLYTAMSRDTNDIGYTYVEICISQQTMWCYENGTCIVNTPVVTGNPNKGNATPSGGVWAIDAKKRDAILVGEGYQAPVDYWMPFNGDVGIHDMQNRAYFGGSIYLSNGSHGCVNTPYEQAAAIYNAVSVGTPVIVYE